MHTWPGNQGFIGQELYWDKAILVVTLLGNIGLVVVQL